MYSDQIVLAVKTNGRILREIDGVVTLPFGSEYALLVKNLRSVRIQIAVSVDGQDAAGRLVIPPNSSLDLERFIRNGNLSAGNRFKFIERTAEIDAHRGIGLDDGMIRVEAWPERVPTHVDVPIPRYYDEWKWPKPRWPRRPSYYYKGDNRIRSASSAAGASAGNVNYTSHTSDTGITVAGSESHQPFVSVSDFPIEPQSVVLVLRLRGEIGGGKVHTPVTVEMKSTCPTCGRKSAAGVAFCVGCGTSLRLI